MTYTFTEQAEEDFGTGNMDVWLQKGTLEQDIQELVLWQTVTAVSWNGESAESPQWIGQRLRWGYLQVGNSLIISPFWDELRYDDDLGRWMDNPDDPFGNYWLRLVKQ